MGDDTMSQTIDEKVAAALSLHQQGQLDEAEPIYRGVLERAPEHAQALSLLGTLCLQTGRDEEAADLLERAIARKPDEPGWLANLGVVLRKLERYPEGADALRRSLKLKPKAPETLSNLGLVLHQMAEFEEAIESFKKAIALKDTAPGFHLNLGSTYLHLGKFDEATESFRRAVALAPAYATAHSNLGMALFRAGQLQAAEAAFRQATELAPKSAEAWLGLGMSLRDQGRMEAAVEVYQRGVDLDPDNAEGHQGLLFNRNYLSRGTPADALAHARHYGGLIRQSEIAPHANDRDPDRILRVGFVSADYRTHPVGQFFGHLLPHFDRSRLHVTAFANQDKSDQTTLRMKAAADGWHQIIRLKDEAAEALIRDERIDILVDLSGHTGGNRMRLFARKPAPVQATWLGYSGTTGVDAIDHIIADASIIPPEDEPFYSETPIRLPGTYLCYSPPVFSGLTPKVSETPALANGFVTFGTYNNIYKISDETVACWADILRAVPTSKLLLKHGVFTNEDGQKAMQVRFAGHGIGAERLLLKPSISSHFLHFQSYGEIDIGLDPFPYNGTTTTCDALWMGVPLVTLIGDRFISRVGSSLVRAVGLDDLAAPTLVEYVEAARALAGDLPRLSAIRARLRPDMMASTLGDAPRFARDLEVGLRQMWRRWCAGPA